MSRSIQEGPGGLGYLSFRDDQGAQAGLLTLWTLVDRLWILLVDLGWVKQIFPLLPPACPEAVSNTGHLYYVRTRFTSIWLRKHFLKK